MDAEKIKDLMTQAYNHLSVAAVAGDAAEHVGDARKLLRAAFAELGKTTYYAQVDFNANGGTGAPSSVSGSTTNATSYYTLYAVWSQTGGGAWIGNGYNFNTATAYIWNGAWQRYTPYVWNDGWKKAN